MSQRVPADSLIAATRTLQIVVFAMCIGLVTFGLISWFIGGDPADDRLLTWISIGFAALAIVLAFTAPRLMASRQRQQLRREQEATSKAGDQLPRRLIAAYSTSKIVTCAILEGAAFFVLVVFLLEGQALSLVIATVLVAAISLQFPTLAQMERWVDRELRFIEEGHQLP